MNKRLSVFIFCALAPIGPVLWAQNSDGSDNGLSLTSNPDKRHQALNQRQVLRSKYKGPKTTLPNANQSKNRAYSLKPKVTEVKNGPITLVNPLTPVPTLAPIIPRDAKGNPITLWAPGKKIDLPTSSK